MRIARLLILTMGIVTACAATLKAQGPYPASNLVGYWTFEDSGNLGKNTAPGGGGDLAPDSGGTGVPTAVAGKIGTGAVDFNHYVNGGAWLEYNNGADVPTNIPVGNNSYSISVWVDIRTAATGPIGKPGFVSWGIEAPFQQSTLGFETADVNVNVELQNWWHSHKVHQNISIPPYNFDVNTGWHHFGVTFDTNTNNQALYFDGVQIPPICCVPEPNIGAALFRIGSGPDNLGPGNQMSMDGQLDDLSIWNVPLAPTDFTVLYANGVGAPATILISPPGVPGDYNNNGFVDSADYVLWRKDVTPLTNEVAGVTPGDTTPEDYDAWRARFGNTSGSGSSLGNASVPEPAISTLVILLSFALALFTRQR